MPLHFIISQKGKPLLTHKGYVFQKLRDSKTKVTWRCTEYTKLSKCGALLHTTTATKQGTVLDTEDPTHTHAPDIAKTKARTIMEKIKKRSKQTTEPTSKVLAKGLAGISPTTSANLPNMPQLTRVIQRTRAKTNSQLPTPSTRGELQIPDTYTKTLSGKLFLLHDNGGDKKRFLLFATKENLQHLAASKTWFCDGTFRSVPTIFAQLYTIHGMVDGKVIPFVYVMAPSKSKRMYEKVLQCLTEAEPSLYPEKIVIDFERSFITAVQNVFDECEIQGCHFHYGQCIWRHVQQFGLQKRYSMDAEFALNIKMLIALAFVPCERVEHAFEALATSIYYKENHNDLENIVQYLCKIPTSSFFQNYSPFISFRRGGAGLTLT
ncbi:uncharacterized protein LOC124407954 [Diprion similis]|uniref:uncharacterized protein LOC124407954 n=1 Tax=Diprion similis TaxID=362088 RepID=UPI001EF87987|nr:uncharacterized protein LOC124407954 [Diprion similis]